MSQKSAGLLIYRIRNSQIEVLLIHPGGPFWEKKDAWSIPKGLYLEDELPFDAAKREFNEETGFTPPAEGNYIALTSQRQSSGKLVTAWAIEGDFDASKMTSNLFDMVWPPNSGKMQKFPEADRADWFNIKDAKKKIFNGQVPFLDELERLLSNR